MKALFTTQPHFGHWHPLVPFALALVDAGHEVAFATAPDFCRVIEADGFRCFSVGKDETPEEKDKRRARLEGIPGPERAAIMWRDYFGGVWARETLADLLPLAREWQPDLIVREDVEFAGCVAAERLGVPHAVVQAPAYRPFLFSALEPSFRQLRLDAGLPPNEEIIETLHRYLYICSTPPSFRDPATALPPTTHFVFPEAYSAARGRTLPEWVGSLPDLPTVYATLGTVMNYLTGILAAVRDALREEKVNLIMTTGPDVDPSVLGPETGVQPGGGRLYIERYIPQNLILPYCDLMIVHGGSGTLKDAFRHGLPMVIIPIGADQYVNAKRCAELGFARIISSEERTPEAIRAAVREVMGNPDYRRNAEKMRDEVRAMPGTDEAVRLFERLARERTPLTAQGKG